MSEARPDPHAEAARVCHLPNSERGRVTVLTLWCETGLCRVGRVYRLEAGDLLETTGETDLGSGVAGADDRHLWVGHDRSACWLDDFDDDDIGIYQTHPALVYGATAASFTVTCRCQRTNERLVTYRAVVLALASDVRNLGIADLPAADMWEQGRWGKPRRFADT